MSPQSSAGKTGPVWLRWPPSRSPLFAIAGVFSTYGLLFELVAWQIRTCLSLSNPAAVTTGIAARNASPRPTARSARGRIICWRTRAGLRHSHVATLAACTAGGNHPIDLHGAP